MRSRYERGFFIEILSKKTIKYAYVCYLTTMIKAMRF